jgi:hypothetical protein
MKNLILLLLLLVNINLFSQIRYEQEDNYLTQLTILNNFKNELIKQRDALINVVEEDGLKNYEEFTYNGKTYEEYGNFDEFYDIWLDYVKNNHSDTIGDIYISFAVPDILDLQEYAAYAQELYKRGYFHKNKGNGNLELYMELAYVYDKVILLYKIIEQIIVDDWGPLHEINLKIGGQMEG